MASSLSIVIYFRLSLRNLSWSISFLCSIDEGVLKIANVFPGLKFQYSSDLKTWENVEDVSDLEGKIMLRTRSENSLLFSF